MFGVSELDMRSAKARGDLSPAIAGDNPKYNFKHVEQWVVDKFGRNLCTYGYVSTINPSKSTKCYRPQAHNHEGLHLCDDHMAKARKILSEPPEKPEWPKWAEKGA